MGQTHQQTQRKQETIQFWALLCHAGKWRQTLEQYQAFEQGSGEVQARGKERKVRAPG